MNRTFRRHQKVGRANIDSRTTREPHRPPRCPSAAGLARSPDGAPAHRAAPVRPDAAEVEEENEEADDEGGDGEDGGDADSDSINEGERQVPKNPRGHAAGHLHIHI